MVQISVSACSEESDQFLVSHAPGGQKQKTSPQMPKRVRHRKSAQFPTAPANQVSRFRNLMRIVLGLQGEAENATAGSETRSELSLRVRRIHWNQRKSTRNRNPQLVSAPIRLKSHHDVLISPVKGTICSSNLRRTESDLLQRCSSYSLLIPASVTRFREKSRHV